MASEDFTIQVGEENLRGTIEWAAGKKPPSLLFLHGAGTGNAVRWAPTSRHLAEQGISSVRFDFSGHGQSSGEMKNSNIAKRVEEACAVTDKFFGEEGPKYIAGSSMGGPIAARLAMLYSVEALILLCPAAYAREAENVSFDERFTKILRTPNSWRNSETWIDIEDFQGDLLHIIGERDDVIPPEVSGLYRQHAVNARSTTFEVIEGADHSLNLWLDHHPEEQQRVWSMMKSLISQADLSSDKSL